MSEYDQDNGPIRRARREMATRDPENAASNDVAFIARSVMITLAASAEEHADKGHEDTDQCGQRFGPDRDSFVGDDLVHRRSSSVRYCPIEAIDFCYSAPAADWLLDKFITARTLDRKKVEGRRDDR